MLAALSPSLLIAVLLAQPAAPAASSAAVSAAPATSGPAAAAPSGPAEPAPPEPSSSAATPTLVPPPPPPSGGPAVAAPAASGPGSGAPAGPAPTPSDLTPPNNTAAVFAGFGYRLGTVLSPTVGFSFGASFNRRYATLAGQIALGWQVDFMFDRFNADVQAATSDANGQAVNVPGTRTTTSTSFAALQTLGVEIGPSHVWLGAGAGLNIGFLSTPEVMLQSQSATSYQPFARVVAGADFALDGQTALGLRVGYAKLLTSATVSSGTNHWDLVGDLLDIQGGLFYRFH